MKRLISLAVSLLILAVIYRKIHIQGLLQALQHSGLLWMAISLGMVVPITLITAWDDMHGYFWHDKAQLVKITATSIFLWFLHLLQIWLFILALKAWVPFVAAFALSPLAILAGLLPFTFAGVGTRDAALIMFYRPFFDAPTAAALGLLCTSRYLLPALAGLPFLGQYVSTRQRLR